MAWVGVWLWGGTLRMGWDVEDGVWREQRIGGCWYGLEAVKLMEWEEGGEGCGCARAVKRAGK